MGKIQMHPGRDLHSWLRFETVHAILIYSLAVDLTQKISIPYSSVSLNCVSAPHGLTKPLNKSRKTESISKIDDFV